MTTAKSKELQRIENWLKAVNIDSSKSQDLIDKYGLENAYKLVQEALMRPHDMAEHLDGAKRSSRNTINYLLENRLTAEQISASTRVNIETVKAKMPQEIKIETVERPEPALATAGNTPVTTNETAEEVVEQTQSDTRAETKAALIDQAEASTLTDEEKRNPLAETQSTLFDTKMAQRYSTAEAEAEAPATTEKTSTDPMTSVESIYEENCAFLASMIKEDLGGPAISPDLSPEEQKEALIQQYADLRKEHYEALCYNSGLDMYTSSAAICQKYGSKKAMNRHIWCGCKDISTDIVPADSTARKSPQLITMENERNSLNAIEASSCAITGATIINDICEKMEFENGATFTPPSSEGSQYRSAAGHFSAMDRQTLGYTGSGTMKSLLSSGKIGPGDRISTDSPDTQSGYHLRTIIAVNRNEQGEVTGYVIQGNNNLELSYHDINDKNDPFNQRKVKYSSTSQWTQDQIDQECANMKDLSIEEIQAKIEQEKDAITATIMDTALNHETRLAEFLSEADGKYQSNKQYKETSYYKEICPRLYDTDLHSTRLVFHDVSTDALKNIGAETLHYTFEPIKSPNDTTSRQNLKEELTSMKGSDVTSADTYFKNRKFEKQVDEHAKDKSDEKTKRIRRTRRNRNSEYTLSPLWSTYIRS